MSPNQKGILKTRLTLVILWSVSAFPAFAAVEIPDPKGVTINAEVESVFHADFTFYKDTNPDPKSTTLGTRIFGKPAFTFNLAWDKQFDDVVKGDRVVKMARALGAKEFFRVLIGIINNTGRSYTISHTASKLSSANGDLPDGAYTVTSFVDPGEGRPAIGDARGAQQAAKKASLPLYTSDKNGTGTVIQLVYAISSGFDEKGARPGVDATKLVDIGVKTGIYSGDLTITVDLSN